jgi:hypothetical protein
MSDFYALTALPLPAALHGAEGNCAIRTLADWERLSIEDYFSRKEIKANLDSKTTAVVIPHSLTGNATLRDFALMVEFALGILSVSGFQPVATVAHLNETQCVDAILLSYAGKSGPPAFPKKLVRAAASTWLRVFFETRLKINDRLHVTGDRFVRYLGGDGSPDSLVDLCICLESLIEVNTEIAFRFAVCLSKVAGGSETESNSELLADLYDLRSKVVHGGDATKEHRKVKPNAAKLRSAARTILTAYILYVSKHGKDEWKRHLKRSLLV